MEFRPILSAMLRNKTGVILIALQIAVTLAVLCNALFIIEQRNEKMARPTGIDVENIFRISVRGLDDGYSAELNIAEDMRAIRQIPGVVSATPVSWVPLSGGAWSQCYGRQQEPGTPTVCATTFMSDEAGIETLGLNLTAGRGLREHEVLWREQRSDEWPPVGLLTQAMADELFPDGENPLGQTLYMNGNPIQVVGIVERMQGAWINWSGFERNILLPMVIDSPFKVYMVRAEPGERDRLMPLVEEALTQRNPDRIVAGLDTLENIRFNSYRQDYAMSRFLLLTITLVVVVTSLGIVGLASYNVTQRTKQIGTRRALGARRVDILRYFLLENWLVTTMGLALGVVLTFGLNYWMVNEFELARLDWRYVPWGVLALWVLGQSAAFLPARRAAMIPPALATRTV